MKMANSTCWNITNKCNDHCQFCYRDQTSPDLNLKGRLAVIDNIAASGIQKLTFAGGEPLLMPEIKELIQRHLRSECCMIRYIYTSSCYKVKNGGRIVPISAASLLAEAEPQADLWLLEPSDRKNNLYCCNISLHRNLENLYIEFVGEGLD